jgi:hypothetical protein
MKKLLFFLSTPLNLSRGERGRVTNSDGVSASKVVIKKRSNRSNPEKQWLNNN